LRFEGVPDRLPERFSGQHLQSMRRLAGMTLDRYEADERNVCRAFGDVLAEAKLPRMRIHDLRHTCATLLLAQGVHPKAVQEILGHSQISLTLDTYSTVLPSVSREAAEQMDVVLRA